MVGNTRWTQGQVHCETGFASGRICTNQLWRRTHHQAAAWFALLVSHQLDKICTPSLSFCTFWCKKCLHQMLHKLARCQNWKMFVSFLTFYKQPVQQRCSQKILQQPSQRRSSAPILDCSMICSFWHKRRNQPYTVEEDFERLQASQVGAACRTSVHTTAWFAFIGASTFRWK